MENEEEIRKRQDEIVALKTTIKNQGIVSLMIMFVMHINIKLVVIIMQLSIINHCYYLKGQAYAELKASTTGVESDTNALGAQSRGGIIGKAKSFHL